jgi:hypothetical protein
LHCVATSRCCDIAGRLSTRASARWVLVFAMYRIRTVISFCKHFLKCKHNEETTTVAGIVPGMYHKNCNNTAGQASVRDLGGWRRCHDDKAGSAFRRCRRVRGCRPSSRPRNPGNVVFGLDVYGKICRSSSHANFLPPLGKDITSTAVLESEEEKRAAHPKAPFIQWKSYNAWPARYGTSLHSEFIATARCSRRNCRGVARSRLSKTSFRNY